VSTEVPPAPEHRLSAEAADDIKVMARGGATQIVGQITQRSISFFFTVAATNILGVAGYGLYRKAQQVLAVVGQVGLAGFNYSAMRFIARARARGDVGGVRGAARTGVAGTVIASAVVVIAVVVFAGPLAASFSSARADPDDLERLLRIGALYIPAFAVLQVLRYCSQAYKTMVPSVVAGNIIQPIVRFVLGVALLLMGFGVVGAVTSLVVSMAVAALAAGWLLVRVMTPEEKAATARYEPGAMTRFALAQGGASLLGVQSLGLGILVLSALSGNRDVGLFAVGLSLQGPGGVFLSGIVNIWAPVVSDLYERGEIARLDALYKTITRWILTFALPVYAALILESDLFVKFFGEGARDAAPIVAILALGNIFYSGTGPTGYVLSMSGRPGINFINSIVAVAVYAALGIVVVPRYGVVGMAWVDAGVTTLVNLVRVVQAKVLVGVQPFGRSILKPVFATMVGAAVLLAWRLVPGSGIVVRIAGLVVATGAYLLVLRALGLDPEERYVWQRIRSRATKMSRRDR
jgi:O-antigen/teichoic acid export membrane protein